MAHPGLAWVCSFCRRERAEGQPHVCKTDEPRPRCTCVRPQLILEGDVTEICPGCGGVRHAGSGPKAAPESTLDALARRLEDAVGAAQEQAAPGHLLCTAALEVAEVLRTIAATLPPGAPAEASPAVDAMLTINLAGLTPEAAATAVRERLREMLGELGAVLGEAPGAPAEASPAEPRLLLVPPALEEVARIIVGVDLAVDLVELEAKMKPAVAEWLEIRAKCYAAELQDNEGVDVLRRMGHEAFAAGHRVATSATAELARQAECSRLVELIDEKRRGARRRERRVLKALRRLLTKGEG